MHRKKCILYFLIYYRIIIYEKKMGKIYIKNIILGMESFTEEKVMMETKKYYKITHKQLTTWQYVQTYEGLQME